MGSIARVTGGACAAILAAGTMPTADHARSMAASVRVVRVPCGTAALAAAITTANTRRGTVLRLAARCVYDITTPATADTGLPDITGVVTLVGGPSTTIRRDPAAPAFRILNVAAGGLLRVAGISIRGGSTPGLGGGVRNSGRLVLREVTLSGDTAANGGAVANLVGAGMIAARTLFTANSASAVGGGAVLNFGTLTATLSVLRANSAAINGGAVNTQPGALTQLIQSTVAGNTSGGRGGGLANLGRTELVRTLVEGNRGSAGGGIATGNTGVRLSRSIVRGNRPDDCGPADTVPGCVN